MRIQVVQLLSYHGGFSAQEQFIGLEEIPRLRVGLVNAPLTRRVSEGSLATCYTLRKPSNFATVFAVRKTEGLGSGASERFRRINV